MTQAVCAVLLQVPVGDNYYAALNSAVFSDGSFVYVPKGVRSPMELSTYFRINASETGQVPLGHTHIRTHLHAVGACLHTA